MRVPLEWLKQYVDVTESAEEIGRRLTMGGAEVEGIEESAIGPVLDVYITPNRGDCLSIVGVAREIAALYDLPLKAPAPPTSEEGGATAEQTSVTIEAPDLCPRYTARLIKNIKVESSPVWMQQRLEAAGQRPINNIVDVTNYVLLELGQPLHAFDFDKLAEQRIVVRRAHEGEVLTTLDGSDRELTPNMLVIADAKQAVAVAGVMGGADSEVSETTTNLLLESAHFTPLSIRRTARALGMRTEASYRFERVVGPELCRYAADRACELLAATGQPEAVPGVVDVIPNPIQEREITMRVSRATLLLGMEITAEIAQDCLRRLDIAANADGDVITAHVPPRRADLTLEEDLIEEVGRIYGYENIPETLPHGDTTTGGDSEEGKFISRLRQILAGCGLQECLTHSLSAPSAFDTEIDSWRRVTMRNALSAEVSGLRRSLLPTLLDAARHNAVRGQKELALFEVGHVWQNEANTDDVPTPKEYIAVAGLLVGPLYDVGWQRDNKPVPADFGLVRGIVERLLTGLEIADARFAPMGEQSASLPAFHTGRTALLTLGSDIPAGVVGEIHPALAAKYELRDRIYVFEIALDALKAAAPTELTRFTPLSRFPSVHRDLAPRVAESVAYSAIEAAVRAAEVPLLAAFAPADVFRGGPLPEGIKSVTLALTFRSPARTLSDEEVNDGLEKIRAQLIAQCGAEFVQ